MIQKQYNSTQDFIFDTSFMNWVLHPGSEDDKYWLEFQKENPDKQEMVKEAVMYIKALQITEPQVSELALDKIYQKIESSNNLQKRRILLFKRVAAVVLLLLSVGAIIYYSQKGAEPLPFTAINPDKFENGKVILPDGTVNEFDTDEADIQQTKTGTLTINNDTVQLDNFKGTSNAPAMTQVIVPYGKHSEITLVDGTKIWLNAGSQLSYPVQFLANSREVFLSGEAFFDVTKNPSKPFHVITSDMQINVTGTRFNVSSYTNDEVTQTVLLSGKINAKRNKRFARLVELTPGDRLVFNKEKESLEKDRVNVELYSSWIEGYLVFDNILLTEVFKKLERYYNQKIDARSISRELTFSGKLDLADDLSKVLKNIGFSASFSVKKNNDIFILKPLLPVK